MQTIRRILWVILGCLPAAGAFAQAEADSLGQLFTRYQLNAFQEKLFVHVNKTFYLAGETAWFKVYDVDAYLHRPSSASSIADVEIVDKDQRPVLQARVSLAEGSGAGSLLIPTSTPSGHYRLRAYTNWMRNFSPDFYYEQTLTIVNTLMTPAVIPPPARNTYSIQLFPEGGNLVAGIASKIAFKITNRYGEGIAGHGVLVNRQNDTVAHFATVHAGMGSFTITPQTGETYTALVSLPDTMLSQPLPSSYAQGYAMQLREAGDGRLTITVSATASFTGAPVYLLAHTRQLLKSMSAGLLEGGRHVFTIDKNILGDGISHFTVFNAARQPVCERLYFKRPAARLLIDAATDKQVYATREKVHIPIATKDGAGHAAEADMSLSVFLLDSLQPLRYTDIGSWLLLSSDIGGYIEDPAWYFDDRGAAGDAAADNLMLTQGWRRFRWEEVLQGGRPLFEYLPEKEGPVLRARLTDRRSARPAGISTAWLSVPGPDFVLGAATSRADGSLTFNLDNFYGRSEIIVQADALRDSAWRLDIAAPWSEKYATAPLPPFRLSPLWKGQLEYRSINLQAENSYDLKNKERYALPASTDTTVFYGPPDRQYYLDDYTRFTTMEEVMREYVAEVRVRQQSGKFSFRVENLYFNNFFDNAPLLLLDGVPLSDAGKILSLDPLKIKKIEIMARKYYFGGQVAEGILSYKTYDGDLGGYPLDPNAVVVEYEGLQREREFYAPVYETTTQLNSRLPDTRNALHWAPHIKTTPGSPQEISFYTGDIKGKFAVLLQGISKDGLPGSRMLMFDVR